MYTVHGRGSSRSLFLLRFGNGLILVQINLQHSQAQPYGVCGVSHREAVSTIFGMTRPRVD